MDSVITLIGEEVTSYDDEGNKNTTTTEQEVFCQIFGITRSEFYAAATANLHPELTARISDFADYHGEKLARYDGVLYSIIRVYRDRGSLGHRSGGSQMDPNAVELILERKIGNVRP